MSHQKHALTTTEPTPDQNLDQEALEGEEELPEQQVAYGFRVPWMKTQD